ncbi:hypothetical protein DID88_003131 [Monilinia fructigena]|uniref:Nucleoside phosphorylase domain-containing protein n=1 Tax=Monilinia fructigena TaxID=38457 RepID=A0A395IX05_9HELO|nr:hypothetical protein DID88_003131 [Monilinia fructigena]
MAETSRLFKHNDYSVGLIYVLPETELVVVRAMLDEVHPVLPPADPKDTNVYCLGRIGSHNIVIACLPAESTGKASAAIVAKDMLRSFKAIRYGLVVGIGGGAPYFGDPDKDEAAERHPEDSDTENEEAEDTRDIRLGDIVTSLHSKSAEAVVQYDFRKSLQGGEFLQTWILNKPP